METLTREPDTMRVRQIKPGEEVQSLYDELASPSAEFWLKTSKTGLIRTSEDVPPGISPYVFYNDTDAAEDAVLFEDEPSGGLADNAPFVEIQNPTQQLESSSMPLSILNRTAEQMEEELPRVVEETLAIRRTRNQDGSVSALPPAEQPYVPGAGQFPYSAPPVWVQAHKLIADGPWDPTRAMFLDKLDFGSIRLELSMDELKEVAKTQEILERDRAYSTQMPLAPSHNPESDPADRVAPAVFKDTFHLGDLVPGAQDRYKEAMDIIIGVQKYQSPHPQQHDQWAWFCMDVLDRLNLKLYYDDFNFNVSSPWPHRYIVQDIVQAFMAMGLFFPGVKETSIIHEYLESEQGRDLKAKASQIFDPASRRARRPDVRTRTSMDCRPKKFWKEWDELYPSGRFCVDTYPWDSSMAIRPIIAKRKHETFNSHVAHDSVHWLTESSLQGRHDRARRPGAPPVGGPGLRRGRHGAPSAGPAGPLYPLQEHGRVHDLSPVVRSLQGLAGAAPRRARVCKQVRRQGHGTTSVRPPAALVGAAFLPLDGQGVQPGRGLLL